MERLTIKELDPYLPYDLEVIIQGTHTSSIRNLTKLRFDSNFLWNLEQGWVKILDLQPLSSLTEERTDSQYSTLIEQIVKECEQHCDAYDEWLEIFIDDPDPSRILQSPYEVVQELLAQKFDVFGLIDRNLALPIEGKEVKP